MKVRDLILALNVVDPEATVKVKVEICKNWQTYCEWAPIEYVDDYIDTVYLEGE